jgi:hypothetical protein
VAAEARNWRTKKCIEEKNDVTYYNICIQQKINHVKYMRQKISFQRMKPGFTMRFLELKKKQLLPSAKPYYSRDKCRGFSDLKKDDNMPPQWHSNCNLDCKATGEQIKIWCGSTLVATLNSWVGAY